MNAVSSRAFFPRAAAAGSAAWTEPPQRQTKRSRERIMSTNIPVRIGFRRLPDFPACSARVAANSLAIDGHPQTLTARRPLFAHVNVAVRIITESAELVEFRHMIGHRC